MLIRVGYVSEPEPITRMNRVPKHASRPQVKQIHHPYPRHFLPTGLDYFQNLLDRSIVSCEVDGRHLVMALRIRVSAVAMDYFYCPKISAHCRANISAGDLEL